MGSVCPLYFEEEPGRRTAANLLTRDEVRRIAANIAKIPKFSHGGATSRGRPLRCYRGRGGINNNTHTPIAVATAPQTINANATSYMVAPRTRENLTDAASVCALG